MTHSPAFARTVGLALLLPLHAAALQPLITDDTGTQGSGGSQLELALERERIRAPGERSTLRTFGAVYTRGLTDTLDGYVEVNHARLRSGGEGADGDGAGNPALGLKWRLWENASRKLSVALAPEVQLGAARSAERRGLASGRTGYAGTLIVTQATDFGAVHWNVSGTGVRYALGESRRANREHLYRVSVAPVVDVAPGWQVALDVGAVTNPDRGRRARMGYVELATIWSPREDLELALGVIALVGDGEPRSRTLSAGVTWRF